MARGTSEDIEAALDAAHAAAGCLPLTGPRRLRGSSPRVTRSANPTGLPAAGRDISGYTAFLVGTELEHANAIVHELTTLIREGLSPPMRFVKLEGDAVFCYADETAFEDGERLIELIESCYFDFSNRLLDMVRGTTCRCAACASIGSLDLKFVAHYGTYVLNSEGDREDLAGPDVILVHRLLKNTVGDGDGPQAYAFLTDPCLQRIPPLFDLPSHSESYDSFGQTTGGVQDLEPVRPGCAKPAASTSARRMPTRRSAWAEHPYPPAVVWQYFVDPEKRLRWQPLQTAVKNQPNQQGRLGPGATSHCAHGAHGDVLREYLDWRPCTYFTNGAIKATMFAEVVERLAPTAAR